MYASSDTSDSNNLLQSVSFDVSCSLAAPLNAPDRFGSLELISYLNEDVEMGDIEEDNYTFAGIDCTTSFDKHGLVGCLV